MNWLAILMAFQIGTFNNTEIINNCDYSIIWESPNKSFYTKINVGIELFEHINIFGYMKSYQVHKENIYFDPYRIDYGFNANIKIKNIELGFFHECNHPILYTKALNNIILSQKTEIYLKYELKIIP
jgi:hypothetical protein